MDRATRLLAEEHQAARQAARAAYLDAVRGWVLTGRHALPADAVRQTLPRITSDIALAHAHFRLGVWLRRHGNAAEGDAHLAEASRLHPDSWTIWRQAADLEEVGNASGEAFWQRVEALGEKPYYPPAELGA
jgi:Flp pilus assembly protein TadD